MCHIVFTDHISSIRSNILQFETESNPFPPQTLVSLSLVSLFLELLFLVAQPTAMHSSMPVGSAIVLLANTLNSKRRIKKGQGNAITNCIYIFI